MKKDGISFLTMKQNNCMDSYDKHIILGQQIFLQMHIQMLLLFLQLNKNANNVRFDEYLDSKYIERYIRFCFYFFVRTPMLLTQHNH